MSDSPPSRYSDTGDAGAPAPQLLPAHTPTCMGCGPDNPHGLQMVAYRSADTVYADITFDHRHVGAPGLAHGGAVAAACDDLFGFTLWIAGVPAVTRSLTIEYLLPVPLQLPHRITAHITARIGRQLHVSATGTSTDAVTRFTATAVFITVDVDHFAAHGDVGAIGEMLAQVLGGGSDLATSPGDPLP